MPTSPSEIPYPPPLQPSYPHTVSILIVSFNTRDLLRECLDSALAECAQLPAPLTAEILVVDNASSDLSAEMVDIEFLHNEETAGSEISPTPIRLLRSPVNLGFAAANNLAIEAAQGRYLVLLNSDAFFHPGSLARAIAHMDADPTCAIGGARLVSRDGAPQPSARCFPSIFRDALVLTGLADRHPRSRIFGSPDRTWADPNLPASVDWVPGAFSILRREALAKTGLFDPAFFLYYEEVDLCRRVKSAGFRVLYWPGVVVTHIGGESGRQLTSLKFSSTGSQVVLWRMRATLLYYRKHHGAQVWLARWLEEALYTLRHLRNRRDLDPLRYDRSQEALHLRQLLRQAWRETNAGRTSPPRPW
jgi:GT2 family glycosyltransferase